QVAPRRGIVGPAAVRLRAGLRFAVLRSIAPGLAVFGTLVLGPAATAASGPPVSMTEPVPMTGPVPMAEPVPMTEPVSMTEQERAAALVEPSVVYLEVHWEGWVRAPATQ